MSAMATPQSQYVIADYIGWGWALVPIPAGEKGPKTKGWPLPENAVTQPEDATALTGNVGLAHAYCTPTPTMALDIDDMAKATEWLSARKVDLEALLDAEDAVQIVSGREGRAKLVYRLPVGQPALQTSQIKCPATGDMIVELRCASANGLTMQDVLPPSIHPDTGKPYVWGGKGNPANLPVIPAELLRAWKLFVGSKNAAAIPTVSNSSGVTPTSVDVGTVRDLRSALSHLRADDRALWVKGGLALKPMGDVGRGLWMSWSQTSGKFDPAVAATTWDGFAPTTIDYRFIFAEATRQGWVNPGQSIPSASVAGTETEPTLPRRSKLW